MWPAPPCGWRSELAGYQYLELATRYSNQFRMEPADIGSPRIFMDTKVEVVDTDETGARLRT